MSDAPTDNISGMNRPIPTVDGDWYEDMEDFLQATVAASEAGIKFLIRAHEILDKRARAIFWQRFDSDPEWDKTWDGGWVYRPSIDSIDIDANEVDVEVSARGYCGTDSRTYTFPTSYLWLDQSDILADMKARKESAEKKEAEAKARKESAEKARKEAAEKATYKRLQTKFGGS